MATAVFGIDYETAQRALQIAALVCAVCAGSVVAAVVAYDLFGPLLRAFSRLWRRSRVECVAAAAVLGFVVAWGGSKGTITFPRTNAEYELLKDAGSSVTNDAVEVVYTRHALLPDAADIQMWRRPVASTNDADWAEAFASTVGAWPSPQTWACEAATNWDWVVFTTWQPAPAVQTNGILHVNWLLADGGAATNADELAATPVKTQTAVARDAADIAAEMTEEEAYAAFAPDTAILIDLSLVGTNSFRICPASKGTSLNRAVVDWGDGTKEVWNVWYWGTERTHVYARQGRYVVRLRGVADPSYDLGAAQKPAIVRALRFADTADCGIFSFSGCANLTAFPDGKLARWPAAATEIGGVYKYCTSLAPSELPAWPQGATTIKSTYEFCTSLAPSELPAWPQGATTIQGVFYNCGALNVATLPEWPKGLTNADIVKEYYGMRVYGYCTSLAATNVPAWPSGLADARECYRACPKLRNLNGPLPAWPTNAAFASANYTYYNCTSLTGSIPAWPTNAAFASANSTYNGCTSLTGSIPAWPTNAAFASADRTYQSCTSLTGAWTNDPDELMPAHITSHNNTVVWASAALRALFYSSWGGTRKEGE